MAQPLVFVDAAKAGRADAAALATALSIDTYRARLLLNARVPFLAHGFASLGFAGKAAEQLRAAGIPASAHSSDDVQRVPAGIAASSVTRRASAYLFATATGPREVSFESLRAIVHARITVKLPDTPPPMRLPTASPLARVLADASRGPREPVYYWRLDLFAEPRAGECVRICVRHDLFDFSCLLERKTLSAVRNVVALRDEIAKARPKVDVPVDDWFERTELARSSFADDVYNDTDLKSGGRKSVNAQTNRASFEEFAAMRFLHERVLVPEKADHYLDL